MTLPEFLFENREEIDRHILSIVPGLRIDDRERELWVMNDEWLYGWAKLAGCPLD